MFKIKDAANGEFFWDFTALNNEILAASQTVNSKQSAFKGPEAITAIMSSWFRNSVMAALHKSRKSTFTKKDVMKIMNRVEFTAMIEDETVDGRTNKHEEEVQTEVLGHD
jgi:uncharacterized protein YegP (UPF0339 family)